MTVQSTFPLIKPYPLIERDDLEGSDSPAAAVLAEIRRSHGARRPPISIPGPFEHVQVSMTGRGDDNTLPSLIDSELQRCDGYLKSLEMVDKFQNLPGITQYRNEHDREDASKNAMLNAEANREVLEYGCFLPSGQVLLHGGPWPWPGAVGQFDRPLSCTLCAKVARLHAGYHSPGVGEVWIITVLPCAKVKGLVLSRWAGHDLSHEIETILQSGVVLEKRFSRLMGDCLVHDVNLVGTTL